MEWKTKDGNYENTAYAQFDTFYEGIFQRDRLLDILKNFILFSGDSQKPTKILAGYHQYFAVRKAVEKAKFLPGLMARVVYFGILRVAESRCPWCSTHTYCGMLDPPTIVVMTDRIDLDDQLYSQFAKCAKFLRQTPVQAESKEHLKTLLEGQSARWHYFHYDV